MKILTKIPIPVRCLIAIATVLVLASIGDSLTVHALPQPSRADNSSKAIIIFGATVNLGDPVGGYTCGAKDQEVRITINLECRQKGNPLLDATFAIIRILSIGVGLAVVAGLIIAGIQLTASKGDPQLRAKAIGRIYNVVIALFVYIFAYAILNYVIPAGFFK